MTTLNDIDRLAKAYSDDRWVLESAVSIMDRAIKAIHAQHMPAIRKAAAAATKSRDKLEAAVDSSPELFKKPKTQVLHGIKVGFKKGPGRIEFDDADTVIRLIRKHMPDQADQLIKIAETPIKSAIGRLSVADAKRIGVTLEDTDDEVVISIPDSNLDKLVEALLKGEAA